MTHLQKNTPALIRNVLAVTGLIVLATGIWWEWPALSLVVIGGILLAAGSWPYVRGVPK